MLKPLAIYSQRDSRWSYIILGNNDANSPYTIGLYGCLITCLSMYIGKQPNEINDILRVNSGFSVNSGDFVWSKSSVLGLNETYVSPRYDGVSASPQIITKAKAFLDQGFPLLCEIDFNPATNGEEMHFVLLIGYSGDSFFAADPWTGQIINMDVYGGLPRALQQFRVYDKTLPTDQPVQNPADNDQQRGLDLIIAYRDTRPDGKEGNFEGYTRVLIDRDSQWGNVQKDLKNAQDAVVIAQKSASDLDVTNQGLDAAVKEYKKGIDTLWQMLNPVSGDKNMATIISEVQQLLAKEENLSTADNNAVKSSKKYTDLMAKLKTMANSSSDDETAVLDAIKARFAIFQTVSDTPSPTTPKKTGHWYDFLLFWK